MSRVCRAHFAGFLKHTIEDVDQRGLNTSLIADVHTNLDAGQCLEEGSGYTDYVVVAYKRPEGDIVLAVGPVLSYYEFKHPIGDRLTDEQWREMLQARGEYPARPKWNASYTNLTR